MNATGVIGRSGAMTRGRQADSARRRQRVLDVVARAAERGHGISVSSVARAAFVDRTFLYRHPDLLALVRELQTPSEPATAGERPAAPDGPRAEPECGCAASVVRLTGQLAELRRQVAELRSALTPAATESGTSVHRSARTVGVSVHRAGYGLAGR